MYGKFLVQRVDAVCVLIRLFFKRSNYLCLKMEFGVWYGVLCNGSVSKDACGEMWAQL